MKIAILVDELPTSSAPITVGEETYHLRALSADTHLYVIKQRNDEIKPSHAQYIKMTHLDGRLGAFKRFCGFKIPSFSFFSLYHLIYPYTLTGMANQMLSHYDKILVHYSSTALFATKLAFEETKLLFYCWDPISYIFDSVYSNKWSDFRRKMLSNIASDFDRKLFSKVDLIILPSNFHLRRVRSLTTKPIRVIYPGTEVASQIPKERGDYMLAVARWEVGKNPFSLIDVAHDLGNEFKVLMVGPWRPPEFLGEFKQRAEERGVLKKFEFLGPVFGKELEALYLGARCLIHPKTEAFGFTGLEAAAHGCPMIFPKRSGVTELFENGIHGYFPKEDNIDEYVGYISTILNDSGFAWKMGYEAWRKAKEYTWERHAKELSRVLENTCHPYLNVRNTAYTAERSKPS